MCSANDTPPSSPVATPAAPSPAPLPAPGQNCRAGRIFCLQGLLFLVVYIAGGVTGAALWNAFGESDRPFKHFRENPGRFEEHITRQIVGRYGLPPQSEEQLLQIVRAHNLQLQGLYKEFGPRFEGCMRDMQGKIRELIPPERRAEYDDEVQQMRSRIASFQRTRPGERGRSDRPDRSDVHDQRPPFAPNALPEGTRPPHFDRGGNQLPNRRGAAENKDGNPLPSGQREPGRPADQPATPQPQGFAPPPPAAPERPEGFRPPERPASPAPQDAENNGSVPVPAPSTTAPVPAAAPSAQEPTK